jgi:hypothetical protein
MTDTNSHFLRQLVTFVNRRMGEEVFGSATEASEDNATDTE